MREIVVPIDSAGFGPLPAAGRASASARSTTTPASLTTNEATGVGSRLSTLQPVAVERTPEELIEQHAEPAEVEGATLNTPGAATERIWIRVPTGRICTFPALSQ